MPAEGTEDVGPPRLRATAPEHANNRSRSCETGRLFHEEDSVRKTPPRFAPEGSSSRCLGRSQRPTSPTKNATPMRHCSPKCEQAGNPIHVADCLHSVKARIQIGRLVQCSPVFMLHPCDGNIRVAAIASQRMLGPPHCFSSRSSFVVCPSCPFVCPPSPPC